MKRENTLTHRLITKLGITFFLLIVLMGISYIFITVYFTNKYMDETAQRLNASLASDLIEEKFQQHEPFLADGSVNEALFGDLMHDMMAINRSIEVYLLDPDGTVLYSVVLDHSQPDAAITKVDLAPVKTFIAHQGNQYVLGDDPRNPGEREIFSAAAFEHKGRSGYIYIILAGKELELVTSSLFSSYFLKLGGGATLLTMIFVLIIGGVSIWFLTKNLRTIIGTVKRFREGDMKVRVENPDRSDLSILAHTFNEMADTLVKNMEEIKSVDALRRELIANVSHDLRTPLSVLKGYVETLQIKHDQLSEAEQADYLEKVYGSTEKLSRLVDQLFEYTRLEAQQVKPDKEPFSILDLALDLVSHFKVIADKKQLNIQLKAPETLPLVFADIGLVERAMQNLLENALKFTPQGGEVVLELRPSDKHVAIVVSDTGPGIAAADQPYIFDRYRQHDQQGKAEGAGLGLAIVKKIMELHNTTIRVVSEAEKGSMFLFDLPSYTTSTA